jgi:hypothetical protein
MKKSKLALLSSYASNKAQKLKVNVNQKTEATQQAPNIYNICNFTIKPHLSIVSTYELGSNIDFIPFFNRRCF